MLKRFIAVVLVAVAASTGARAATEWTVVPEEIRLRFAATQNGQEFTG